MGLILLIPSTQITPEIRLGGLVIFVWGDTGLLVDLVRGHAAARVQTIVRTSVENVTQRVTRRPTSTGRIAGFVFESGRGPRI
jgi:hypothetical protein